MKKAIRALAGLAGVLSWVLVAGSVLFLAALGVGPRTGWYRTVTVLSGSMRPGMPEGSVAVVTPEGPSQVRVGQVITYRIPVEDGRIVTHRVVAVVEGAGGDHPVIQTKGDANDTPDPWLARIDDTTVWRARFAVPALGRMISHLRSPVVRTGTVKVVPALLALLWVVAIWRNDEGGQPVVLAEPEPSVA